MNDYDRLTASGAIAPHAPEYRTTDESFPHEASSRLSDHAKRCGARSVACLWNDDYTEFQMRAHRHEFDDALAVLKT